LQHNQFISLQTDDIYLAGSTKDMKITNKEKMISEKVYYLDEENTLIQNTERLKRISRMSHLDTDVLREKNKKLRLSRILGNVSNY